MSDLERALADTVAVPVSSPPRIGPTLERELAALQPVAPRQPTRQLAVLIAFSLAYAALIVFAMSVRRDASSLPRTWLVAAALGWFSGFVVPCYVALIPQRDSMLPLVQLAAIAAGTTAVGFVVLGLVLHPSVDGVSLYYGWANFFHGHPCLWLGLATAIAPVALGTLALRGSLPNGSRLVAAALGAGGGSLGGLVLHFHCPIADGPHVGLIHGGVVGVAALLAAAIVPRAANRAFA